MSYNRKIKHNESMDGIGIPAKFRDIFKDKSSTPIENQSVPRYRIILSLHKYYKEEEVKG